MSGTNEPENKVQGLITHLKEYINLKSDLIGLQVRRITAEMISGIAVGAPGGGLVGRGFAAGVRILHLFIPEHRGSVLPERGFTEQLRRLPGYRRTLLFAVTADDRVPFSDQG